MAQEGEILHSSLEAASRWLHVTPARDKVRNKAFGASVKFFGQEMQTLHHTLIVR